MKDYCDHFEHTLCAHPARGLRLAHLALPQCTRELTPRGTYLPVQLMCNSDTPAALELRTCRE
jgi:hypothetical protein